MEEVIIEHGFTVHYDERQEGYYVLRHWVRTGGMKMAGAQVYRGLGYTEMVDCILAVLDENRPGTALDEAATQRMLW